MIVCELEIVVWNGRDIQGMNEIRQRLKIRLNEAFFRSVFDSTWSIDTWFSSNQSIMHSEHRGIYINRG